MSKRDKLLGLGAGLALFALTATSVNVIVFPYARACYRNPAWAALLTLAAAFAGLVFAGRRVERMNPAQLERMARVTRPLLVAVLLAVHLVMGYLMEYTPMGDNHMLYEGSYTLARLGNFGGEDYDLYLSRFSNQWGFMLILTGINKLLLALGVDNRFYTLVILQAALYVPAVYLLLAMARERRGVRCEIMLTLLLALCLPLYLAAAVLYTDTFSLPFVIFTLYFAQRVPRKDTLSGALMQAALCGLTALIGCQIKMTVAIVLIAAVIVWMLTMKPVRALAAAALSCALLVGGTMGVHRAMTMYVLDPAMVAQHNTPTIHWVMMSIPSSDNPYGGFSSDYGTTWGMQEAGATQDEVMDSILSRMKDKIYTLRYPDRLFRAVMRKNAAAFGDGTFGMTEMLDDGPVRENAVSAVVLEGRPLYRVYFAVTTGLWHAALLFAALSVYADIKTRRREGAIVTIAVFGLMLFMMLWEARGRYIFNFVPLVLLLAADGAHRVTSCAAIIKEGCLWQSASKGFSRLYRRG